MMKKFMAIMAAATTLMGTTFLVGVKNADTAKSFLNDIPVIGKQEKETDEIEEQKFFEDIEINMDSGAIIWFKDDGTYEKFRDTQHIALYLNAHTDMCWTWDHEDDEFVCGIDKDGNAIAYEIDDGHFEKIEVDH